MGGWGLCGLRNIPAAEQLDDLIVEFGSLLGTFVRARDVTHQDFEARVGRANADRGPCRKRPSPVEISQTRPLLFGKMRVCFGFLSHNFLNLFHDRVGILIGGKRDLQLIPEPLARRRKIEVMAFNRVAIDESYAAAGGMAGFVPVASFEQHRLKQSNLNDFAAHSVNLNPVTKTNPVLPHQRKPAEKADDEILECDRETGSNQTHKSCYLSRQPKNHCQN